MKSRSLVFNLSAAALVGIAPALYPSPAAAVDGYVTQRYGQAPLRTRYGECVHDGQWQPGTRYADCDAVPAEAATPAAPTDTVVEAPAPAPVPAPAPIARNVPFRVSTDALFDFDKATLRPLGREALDELATRLASSTYDAIAIVGHADRIGAAKYNQRLSERRAATMRDYLVAKGLDDRKISASGVGSKAPTTTCPHLRGARLMACLQPDRFAEVTVAGTETLASAAAGN